MSTDVLPLLRIFDDMIARFADDSTVASVVFGKREPAKQVNQAAGRAGRVCFVPGVDGKLGAYAPARSPGQRFANTDNPYGRARSLRTLVESASIYVWAFDATGPNDERKQYEAVHLLHDAVVRAIERSVRDAANPNVVVGYSDPQVVGSVTERTFGQEWRFTLQVENAILDSAFPIAESVPGDFGVQMDFADGTSYVDSDELVPASP